LVDLREGLHGQINLRLDVLKRLLSLGVLAFHLRELELDVRDPIHLCRQILQSCIRQRLQGLLEGRREALLHLVHTRHEVARLRCWFRWSRDEIQSPRVHPKANAAREEHRSVRREISPPTTRIRVLADTNCNIPMSNRELLGEFGEILEREFRVGEEEQRKQREKE
jgi:hypothetical protein